MFAYNRPAPTPSLTYGQVLKGIENKEIAKIRIKPGDSLSIYETQDGQLGTANIAATDYFIEKADRNDVDIFIDLPPKPVISISDAVSLGFVVLLAFSIFNSGGLGGGGSMNPLGNSFEMVSETRVKFNDVAGIDEAKGEITEIVNFLRNPTSYENAGAKIPKGCLLSGQPGTGKTLLAKAIAGEAGVPFIAVSASQFIELFVGMGASRIRSLFKQARENTPCIIFIDEIDAIGKKRSTAGFASGGNDEREQTLNQILLEMDGFKANEGIIVVAATNRPDTLDDALLRPGRFDRKIQIDLPDREGRKRILRVHSKNKKLDCSVKIDEIARITMGASGADLANIMNEAAIMAARDGRETIIMSDLEESFEKVTIGLRKNRKVTEETKRIVAYHEAGHALVGAIVNGPQTIQKITIVPRGQTGGVTMFLPDESVDTALVSKDYLTKRIMVGLGGTVAEEHIFGKDKVTTGASGDIKHITQIADAMVRQYGFSDKLGKVDLSMSDSCNVSSEVQVIVEEAYKSTKTYIAAYEDKLHEIAKILLEKETIGSQEFIKIMK